MNLVSLSEYASGHGARRQAATKWIAKGLLVMRDGKVDREASDRRMEEAGMGRFRATAHGGRRAAGVRGAIDRPAMGYGPAAAIADQLSPLWDGWHPPGNPNTLCTDLKGALDRDDEEAVATALDTIQFSQWHDACAAAGWDRWHAEAAAALARALGLAEAEDGLRDALRGLIRARLVALGWSEEDLLDDRLDPR